MDTTRELMTPEQVADYLQISRETVYRYIRDGRLRASKMGRQYRVTKTNVDRLLEDSSTWNGIPTRIYSDEEIAAILEADKLSDEALEVLRRFNAIPRR